MKKLETIDGIMPQGMSVGLKHQGRGYKIEITDNFKKEIKKLIKKYASLYTEIMELGKELSENPTLGTPLGNDVYKIRLSISSKNKGKSGGARLISFVKDIDKTVFLLSIYNKGEKDSISNKEIEILLKDYL